MAGRRGLIAVVLFALTFHVASISQTLLPAQDGLKFIRIARQFQQEPWADVVRNSDAHPLYPALIAVTEPLFAWFIGHGPDTWRIAGQAVAVAASVCLIFPIYGLSRMLFDPRIARIAAALAVLFPRAAELGHDTLSDSLGLLGIFLALWLAALALRTCGWRIGFCSGLAAGLGYLARPEVILVPLVLGLTWITGLRGQGRDVFLRRLYVMAALGASSLAVIGSYAVVKGEFSEKLALRLGASLGPNRLLIRPVPQRAPHGLDDPRWDFSPKEETDRIPIKSWREATLRIGGEWWEELCWFFAVMTVWGFVRRRFIRSLCPLREDESVYKVARRLLLIFAAVYSAALLRHSVTLGYLSGRHIIALLYASVPWAAAGCFVCARGLVVKLRLGSRGCKLAAAAAWALIVSASIITQMQPTHLNHLSRWGHWAAGRWLAAHARPSELVLDTRGWARFVSGHPGYDYWHVRQALTDSHLSYIVVGRDELEAVSPRASTLRALLSYAATPLLEFPAFPGGRSPGVFLYRFHRPANWEGLLW
jgi:4-amino-4-deoxy-L-arabinose transferase-like glycosyltransferase